MIRKLSIWLVNHRFIVLAVIFLITILFGLEALNMKVETRFEDLLPKNHEYIQTHLKYEDQLGAPYKVLVMLKVKKGDIYNQETLTKAQQITDDLDMITGVNHNQIYSIASRKIKKTRVEADAILTENFMDTVPATQQEMDEFRATVHRTGSVYPVWISRDETSLLFSASFIPRLVDPLKLFIEIQNLKQKISDNNHELFIAGEPVLTGWVYLYQKQVKWILGLSFLAMCALLYYYFRNLVGVVVPLSAGLLGIVWGLGFCGLMGYNLEPLSLVIPLLITARALSHSVQLTERYFECYHESKNVVTACIDAATSQFSPGLLGILCDVIGIYLIAVAPIPLMQKLAYLCGFWAVGIIPTALIFTPIMLSFFPAPKNIPDIVDLNKGFTQKLLGWIAKAGYGKSAVTIVIVTVPFTILTGWISLHVNIGDINPGTPILWKDSDYNVAVAEINKNFPGTDELYVLFEGKGKNAIENVQFLDVLDSFQRHMEKNPLVATTLSIQDSIPRMQRGICGGYFKWQVFPIEPEETTQLFYLLVQKSAPEDFDLYFSRDKTSANVIVWFKNHMGSTVRDALSWAKRFEQENGLRMKENGISLKLASGNIGMLAAINEAVEESQLLNLILVMSAVFVLCTLTYRSVTAAIIIMIPLNIANLVTLTVMKALDIGLNINTLPIVSVGVGTGIDYGIYLLSRICENYQKQGSYSFDTLLSSLKTTGKAIFFTNTTMCSGIILFYFFSSLRFQAEMGLLLTIIMFMNMVGALFLIPSMVYVFKPKFLAKK